MSLEIDKEKALRVLRAIQGGAHRASDIMNETNLQVRELDRVIQKLRRMGKAKFVKVKDGGAGWELMCNGCAGTVGKLAPISPDLFITCGDCMGKGSKKSKVKKSA